LKKLNNPNSCSEPDYGTAQRIVAAGIINNQLKPGRLLYHLLYIKTGRRNKNKSSSGSQI